MSEQRLRELIARVDDRLRGGALDAESHRLLGTLIRDIERTLGGAAPAPAAAHVPRLESLAVQFEAGHPALAEALRQLIDALGKAGI
ncbi:MAG: DUF4404 family protein [Steroidobacteraceae bacterium]